MNENRVALVTGASSGIGRACAALLAARGLRVYAASRSAPLRMDVTNDASMIKGIQEIIDTEKRIDVLVNNAGFGSFGALEDVPISDARYQFEVNIFGLARLTQLALPFMRAQKQGRIINVSSMGGRFGEPHGAWYHATKFALEGLSDCTRMELKQFGIDVVVIQPGMIKTEWDIIAGENLLKASGNTAYKELANKQAEMFVKMYKNASEPKVIAKVIAKAATVHKPKTRYVAGSGAKFILFAKSILPDRIFDKIMLSQMN